MGSSLNKLQSVMKKHVSQRDSVAHSCVFIVFGNNGAPWLRAIRCSRLRFWSFQGIC